jgi:hypothetical protein
MARPANQRREHLLKKEEIQEALPSIKFRFIWEQKYISFYYPSGAHHLPFVAMIILIFLSVS